MEQLHSILVGDEAISASDSKSYDLPVNPLGHIWITLKGLNVTDEATLAEILARITKVQVSLVGQTVVDITGADLYALNCIMFGREPILTNIIATDNGTRALTLCVPMGRRLFDATECHPASTRGEFKLGIDFSATETAVDGLILQVETVEFLGASPTKHLKVTTISKTPAATGDYDIDLPRGNVLAGLMVWGTTVVATTAWTNTIESVKLLKNNVESQIAKANWETLHGALLNRCGYIGDHSAAYGDDGVAHYALLDFFPNGLDDFLVPTDGLSSLKLRVAAGDTNALKVFPIELQRV